MSLVVHKDKTLQPHNSMAVPAKASHLVSVENIDQLSTALNYARQHQLAPLVLGEGSNTVFSRDYSGLVILNKINGIRIIERHDSFVLVKVGAGESWHEWVLKCVEMGWHGLENLALIPGLVGAAPMQNIGAYGAEIKDCLESVELRTFDHDKLITLSNQQCEFAYRDSIFKHELANRTVITSVTFRLSLNFSPNLEYPALAKQLQGAKEITASKLVEAVIHLRASKLPIPALLPNSGSFFKNPIVSKAQFKRLKEQYPTIVWFEHDGAIKLAAAWLIEQRGWKQHTATAVRVHSEQALVIINPKKRPGKEAVSYTHLTLPTTPYV